MRSRLIRVRRDGGRPAFAAPPIVHSGPVSADELAELGRILRIDPADLVAAQWLDNGPGWIGVLLADVATVLAVRPDLSACEWLSSVGIVGAHPENSVVAFELRTFMRDGRENQRRVASLLRPASSSSTRELPPPVMWRVRERAWAAAAGSTSMRSTGMSGWAATRC